MAMWPMRMLVPDLVGRREDADEMGRAVAAAYRAGHAIRDLEQPEDHRHAPYIPEALLGAWRASNRATEVALNAFLSDLASSPDGARLTIGEVCGLWEQMLTRATLPSPPQDPETDTERSPER